MKKNYIFSFLLALGYHTHAQTTQTVSAAWANQFRVSRTGLVAASASGAAITTDASGNVYTTGTFKGITDDLDAGSGSVVLTSTNSGMGNSTDDIFVIKHNASGQLLWAKQIGAGGADYGRAITTDALGNVYVAGTFSSTTDFDPGTGVANLSSAGAGDIFVLKLNASGDYVSAWSMGGDGGDNAAALVLDANGNMYLTGHFESLCDFQPGAGSTTLQATGMADIFVLKLNASGVFQWVKQMGGTANEISRNIGLDNTGNIYISGYFNSNDLDLDPGSGSTNVSTTGNDNIFWVKLDASGNFLWGKSAPESSGNGDYPMDMQVDGSGNVYTTGYIGNNAITDFLGTSLSSNAGTDIYVSKINTSGTLVWVKHIPGDPNFNCVGNGITLDAQGNVYTTGYFAGTADFDPGSGNNILTASHQSDLFVLKLTNDGNFVWAKSYGSDKGQSGYRVSADANGNILITGDFNGSIAFDSTTLSGGPPMEVVYDFFMAKLTQSSNVGITPAPVAGLVISFFPNPAQNLLHLELQTTTQVHLVNILGATCYTGTLNTGKHSIDISPFPPGVYFVQTNQGHKGKFVKE